MGIETQIEKLIGETSEMPSASKYTYVQFFYVGEGDKPFICGVYGNASCLDEIESCALEDWEEGDSVFDAPGDYLFKSYYESPQYGEFGMVELAGYWGFD